MLWNIAFPMYDLHPPATDALASWVLRRLDRLALPGERRFVRPDDLLAHWQRGDLLLSQTCGFPLIAQLPQVQVVGMFHYAAPGCEKRLYRSVLIARAEDKGKTLSDFYRRRVVCNAPDSQSGYHALRGSLAQLGVGTPFFQSRTWSGSHRRSLAALREKTADIAAIDCVNWALMARYHPQETAGLVAIGETALTPGLPLITSRHTSPETLSTLREALSAAAQESTFSDSLFINGFSPASRADYDVIRARREQHAGVVL